MVSGIATHHQPHVVSLERQHAIFTGPSLLLSQLFSMFSSRFQCAFGVASRPALRLLRLLTSMLFWYLLVVFSRMEPCWRSLPFSLSSCLTLNTCPHHLSVNWQRSVGVDMSFLAVVCSVVVSAVGFMQRYRRMQLFSKGV